jgi:hypothetical protein
MKKKIIIGIVIVVVIILIVWYVKKKKKEKEAALIASNSTTTAAPSLTTPVKQENILNPPVKTDQTVFNPAVIATQAAAANQTTAAVAGKYAYINVVKDTSKGSAILQYSPVTDIFKVGDKISIASGPYAGTHTIWYVYKGTSVHNLYLSAAFKEADKGTFSKV